MILSDRTIREEIEAGRIVIDPFDPACVQPSSVDLHVDADSQGPELFLQLERHLPSGLACGGNLEAKLERALTAGDPDHAWLKARLAPLVGVAAGPAAQEESFAAKVNAALRNQFGGHAVRHD